MSDTMHAATDPALTRPPLERPQRRWFDRVFAALLLALLAVQLPILLDRRFAPVHDTLLHFQIFHTFYSHALTQGSLPLWFPYFNYGMPTFMWQLWCLTPTDCGAMSVGVALGVRDVMTVYKIAIFLEQSIFLAGMYLLVSQLVRNRGVVFLICLSAISVPIWSANVNHCYRLIYLLPMALFSVFQYMETRRGEWFWRCGGFVVLSLVGNAAYCMGLYLLILMPLLAFFLLADRKLLREPFRLTRPIVVSSGAFVLLSAVFVILALCSYRNLVVMSPGRDIGGDLTIHEFLKTPDLSPGYAFLFGWPVFTENTLYLGLMAWAMLAWGVLFVRTRRFWLLALPLALLLGMANSSLVARGLYYLPIVRQYRPLSYIYTAANVLVLAMAAQAAEHFLQAPRRRQIAFLTVCLAILTAAGVIVASRQMAPYTFGWYRPEFLGIIGPGFLYLRLIAYAAALLLTAWLAYREPSGGFARPGALWFVAVVLDLLLYRTIAYADPRIGMIGSSDRYAARELKYVPARSENAIIPGAARGSIVYSIQSQFDQIEPLLPVGQTLTLSDGVYFLLLTHSPPSLAAIYNFPWNPYISTSADYLRHSRRNQKFSPKTVTDMYAVLGAETSGGKLRLYHQALFVSGGFNGILQSLNKPLTSVLLLQPATPLFGDLSTPAPTAPEHAEVTAFSANRVVIRARAASAGTWLYYADNYDENWSATVNGVDTPVVRAQMAFKAVRLPAGESTIVLTYGGLPTVLAYALFTLCLLGFLAGQGLVAACLLGRCGATQRQA